MTDINHALHQCGSRFVTDALRRVESVLIIMLALLLLFVLRFAIIVLCSSSPA